MLVSESLPSLAELHLEHIDEPVPAFTNRSNFLIQAEVTHDVSIQASQYASRQSLGQKLLERSQDEHQFIQLETYRINLPLKM